MRFYTSAHRFYCGVELHARTMYLCIHDAQGPVVFDKNLPASGWKAGTLGAGRDGRGGCRNV